MPEIGVTSLGCSPGRISNHVTWISHFSAEIQGVMTMADVTEQSLHATHFSKHLAYVVSLVLVTTV